MYNEDDGYWYFQASPQSVQARALLEESALATPSEAEEEIIDEEILDEDELYDHWGLATPSEAEDATPSEGNYDQEEEEEPYKATFSEAVYKEDTEKGNGEEDRDHIDPPDPVTGQKPEEEEGEEQ